MKGNESLIDKVDWDFAKSSPERMQNYIEELKKKNNN
jgi:hypothetical protein